MFYILDYDALYIETSINAIAFLWIILILGTYLYWQYLFRKLKYKHALSILKALRGKSNKYSAVTGSSWHDWEQLTKDIWERHPLAGEWTSIFE